MDYRPASEDPQRKKKPILHASSDFLRKDALRRDALLHAKAEGQPVPRVQKVSFSDRIEPILDAYNSHSGWVDQEEESAEGLEGVSHVVVAPTEQDFEPVFDASHLQIDGGGTEMLLYDPTTWSAGDIRVVIFASSNKELAKELESMPEEQQKQTIRRLRSRANALGFNKEQFEEYVHFTMDKKEDRGFAWDDVRWAFRFRGFKDWEDLESQLDDVKSQERSLERTVQMTKLKKQLQEIEQEWKTIREKVDITEFFDLSSEERSKKIKVLRKNVKRGLIDNKKGNSGKDVDNKKNDTEVGIDDLTNLIILKEPEALSDIKHTRLRVDKWFEMRSRGEMGAIEKSELMQEYNKRREIINGYSRILWDKQFLKRVDAQKQIYIKSSYEKWLMHELDNDEKLKQYMNKQVKVQAENSAGQVQPRRSILTLLKRRKK